VCHAHLQFFLEDWSVRLKRLFEAGSPDFVEKTKYISGEAAISSFLERWSVCQLLGLVNSMYFHWFLMKMGLCLALEEANRTEESVLIKCSKLHACIEF
jgi:hypothetical protein